MTWSIYDNWILILRLVYLKGRSLQECLDSWRRQAKLCFHPCCQRPCNILPPPLFTFTLVSSELESITNTVSGCVNVMIWCLSIVKYCPKCVKVYHKHCGCPLIGAILTLLSFQFQLEPPTPTCDGITGGSVQQQRRWPAGGQVVQQQVAFLPVDQLVACCTLHPAWCTHKHRLALCFFNANFYEGLVT